MRVSTTVFAVLFTALAGSAAAQVYTPRIDAREAQQQARINDGVRSGSLTAAEAASAQAGLNRVRAYEAFAERDGVLTAAERRHLVAMENRESQRIWALKHNPRHL